MVNRKKFEKASFLASSLLVAFVANRWFEQAWSIKTDVGKWILLFVSLVVLAIAIYQFMPEK